MDKSCLKMTSLQSRWIKGLLIVFGLLTIIPLPSNLINGLRFTVEPQDKVVSLYSLLWWHCEAVGDEPVIYSWRYGEADLPIRERQLIYENGTLYIERVIPEDENQNYTCVATSGGRSIQSREATLQLAYINLIFSQQPVSQTVWLGNRTVLSCQIHSLPPAVITWTQDGNPVAIDTVTMAVAGTSTLTLTSTTYGNAGKYKCLATNPLLTVVRYSNEAEITVVGAPVFAKDLQGQAVPFGYTARFDCHYHGNPLPQISWYKSDSFSDVNIVDTSVRIQPSLKYSILSNGSLLVNNVSSSDVGFITCKLENLYGEVHQSVSLNVTGEATIPVFIETVDDISVIEGSTITLPCRATGNPTPEISWQRNDGTSVKSEDQFLVLDKGDLNITAVQYREAGYYTCTASNPRGSVNHTMYLDVLVGPSFIISPDDSSVLEGEMVSLECVAAGNPTPNITWTTPESVVYTVPSAVQDGILVSQNGTLTILRAETRHHGIYTCTASNLVSMVTTSASISVEAPPHFTLRPVSLGVRRGQRVFFHCLASGFPKPILYWTKVGESGRLGTTRNRQVYLNNTMVIHSADVNDTGVYWCHAENTQGSIQAVATLTVSVPPEFILTPANQTVRIGSHVQIDCVASGDPVPTQKWYKDGRELIVGGSTNMEVFPNNTLVISTIQASQVGQYTCTANNVAGSASVTVTIETKDFPEFTVMPSNLTVNQSVNVSFQCKGVAMETPSVIWYKLLPGATVLPLAIQNENGRVFIDINGDLKIKNVTSADSGWYQCVLYNSVTNVSADAYLDVQVPPTILYTNSPQTTERLSSVTLSCQSSGNPAPSIKWISPNGIHVTISDSIYKLVGHTLQIDMINEERDGGNWTCQSCNLLGCETATVQLYVQGRPVIQRFDGQRNTSYVHLQCLVTSLPEPTLNFASQGQTVTSNTAGHIVNGLHLTVKVSMVKMQYTCLATNKYGSDIASISVPGQTSSPAILNVTSVTVTLQNTPPVDQSNLPILGFLLEYSKDGAVTWSSEENTFSKETTTIKNLMPFCSYVFRVAAVNILGIGPYSHQTSEITTLPDAPSQPQNVFAYRSGNDTIMLSWEPPQFMNDRVENLEYRYQVWSMGGDGETTLYVSKTVPHNHSMSVEIDGLVHRIKYTVTVWAVNVALNKDSVAVTVTVDFTVSDDVTDIDLPPDRIIAIVFGILGSFAAILVTVFIVVHIRHAKKSESMSLINPRPSLDLYYMENPKSLDPGRKSGFSLKRRLSGQGFYKLEDDGLYDNMSSQRGGNSTKERFDKDMLLTASNPLYEAVEIQGTTADEATSQGQLSPKVGDTVGRSCEQVEIELPQVTENIVLKPSSVPESSTGSDITKVEGHSLTQQPTEKDAESDVTAMERNLDEIYSLGLSEYSSEDNLYDSPWKSISYLPGNLSNSASSKREGVFSLGKITDDSLLEYGTAVVPIVQSIQETSFGSQSIDESSYQGTPPMSRADNLKSKAIQKDIKISYDLAEKAAERDVLSAALY